MAEETLRRKADEQIKEIHERLYQGELRMNKIEGEVSSVKADLSENTELTRKIWENISGIVAFSDDLAAGSRLLCRLAKGISFVIDKVIIPFKYPLLIVTSVWMISHGGTLPDWMIKLMSVLS